MSTELLLAHPRRCSCLVWAVATWALCRWLRVPVTIECEASERVLPPLSWVIRHFYVVIDNEAWSYQPIDKTPRRLPPAWFDGHVVRAS